MSTPTTSTPDNAGHWPANALLRCWVVWENGAKKTFHSYDTSGRYHVEDPFRYALRGFRTRILDKVWQTPLKEVIVYDHQTGAKLEVWMNNGRRLV